jgi:hypothetical protein
LKSAFSQISIETFLRNTVRKDIIVSPTISTIPYSQMLVIFLAALGFGTLFGIEIQTEAGLIYFLWFLLFSLWSLRALTRTDVSLRIVGVALAVTALAELFFSSQAPVILFPTLIIAALCSLFFDWKMWIPIALGFSVLLGVGMNLVFPLLICASLFLGFYFGRRWV